MPVHTGATDWLEEFYAAIRGNRVVSGYLDAQAHWTLVGWARKRQPVGGGNGAVLMGGWPGHAAIAWDFPASAITLET